MRKRNKDIYFWLRTLVAAAVLVLLLQTFAFRSCLIPSSGMENTLLRGDRIIVNQWSYGLRLPFMSWLSYHRLAEKPMARNDIVVFNNPHPESAQTSVDRREVFISRCIGLPGDTLLLNNQLSLVAPQEETNPDNKQLYIYPSEKEDTLLNQMKQSDITGNELIGYNAEGYIRSFSYYEVYLLKQDLPADFGLRRLQNEEEETIAHPFVIPAKGKSVRIHPWNITLLRNTIVQHEGKQAEIKGDTLLVENRPIYSFVFSKNYYWMVSDNSINLSDSRLFGLVPEDHLIGKAIFVWFSKDSEAALLKGYRWNRFLQTFN